MADFARQSTSDQAEIDGGDYRDIPFRPGQPGLITVRSVPATSPSRSESGYLGKLALSRPGRIKPLATALVRIGQPFLGLSYHATAADLAIAGDWTCEVTNATEQGLTFETNISYVSNFPLRSASFDLGLLNLILSEAVADVGIKIHLETSDKSIEASVVSWSAAVANQLKGQTEFRFNIPDPTKKLIGIRLGDAEVDVELHFRIINLDSDPNSPMSVVLQDSLVLEMTIRFATDGKIVSLDWIPDIGPLPDIDLQDFMITIDVDFNGTITPHCQTQAFLEFNHIDLSDEIKTNVEQKLNENLAANSAFAPKAVRQYFEDFFVRLMRLGGRDAIIASLRHQAHIQGYSVDGQSLIVSYYLTPAAGGPVASL